METECTVTMRLHRDQAPLHPLPFLAGVGLTCAGCGQQAAPYADGWTLWEWEVEAIARGRFYLCPPCQLKADEAHSRGVDHANRPRDIIAVNAVALCYHGRQWERLRRVAADYLALDLDKSARKQIQSMLDAVNAAEVTEVVDHAHD